MFLQGQMQLHFGAFSYCAGDGRSPPASGHPLVYRIGQASPVLGDRRWIETTAGVTYEDLDRGFSHLRVYVDLCGA